MIAIGICLTLAATFTSFSTTKDREVMNNLVEIASIPKPDEAVTLSAQTALREVESVKVVTPQDYETVGAMLITIKSKWNAIDEERKKLKSPIDAAAKAIQDFFRAPLDALATAERLAKGKLATYAQEQERIRREEQAKADALARRERERLEARAAKAEADGKAEKASALQQTAAAVVAPTILRETPKMTGMSTRDVWKWEIVDSAQLPRDFLVPNEAMIRAMVTALRGETTIPGVRVWSEKQISAGAR
jgi:hypothetical protein